MTNRDDVIRAMVVTDGATFQAVANHLGISRERVRQIAGRIGVRSPRGHGGPPDLTKLKPSRRGPNKTRSKTDISLQRLRELLDYDRFTGIWTWRDKRWKMPAGSIAGSVGAGGYIQIRVDRKLYMAHVLAWFYSFEKWPKNQIDHVNRVRSDNRLNNLRQSTQLQNMGNRPPSKNNTSGFKGVYRSGKKWKAECAHVKLGTYDTPELAAEAYRLAAKIRYGDHARFDP